MSLVLNATLASAMDSETRYPLVEIISKEWAASIPMDGQYLDTTENLEQHPSAITLSTGRLANVCYYEIDAINRYIRYRYTDVDRTVFTDVDIAIGSGETVNDISLCELATAATGNIGIVYISTDGSDRCLKYKIITPLGVVVSSNTIRTLPSKTTWCSGPFILTLADNSYLLVFSEFQYIDGENDHYHLYKYTSADFATWTGPVELSISGITDTMMKYNPSLIQITTGQIWLWFAYVDSIGPNDEELINIYYSTSDDNGSTWAEAIKVTAYSTYNTIAIHPTSAQKVADAIYMFYTERAVSLIMNSGATGWPEVIPSNHIGAMHFDSVNRMLYIVVVNGGDTTGYFSGVAKIDVDNWEIVDHWDISSVPAIGSQLTYPKNCDFFHAYGAGRYTVVFGPTMYKYACLIDGEADTITHYYFNTYGPWGMAQNVTWDSQSAGFLEYSKIRSAVVDETGGKIWFVIESTSSFVVLSIPLSSTDNHTSTTLIYQDSSIWSYGIETNAEWNLLVVPERDWVIVNACFSYAGLGGYEGQMLIYSLSGAALYKSFSYTEEPTFPYFGMRNPCHYNGKIYGGVRYTGSYGQSDYRGMAVLDPILGTITYKRPGWASYDEYDIRHVCPMGTENKIFATSELYGGSIFDIASEAWTLYDNDTILNLTPEENNRFKLIAYDSTNQFLFIGFGKPMDASMGLVTFSIHGDIKQTHYYTGAFTSSWAWTNQDELIRGFADYDASIALDPDNASIYAFWERLDVDEYSIKWDREGVDFDLAPYISRDTAITCRRSISGDPARLTFATSHGHLFDPHNTESLLNPYLVKGRKITLRFGERISNTDYWQVMGTFLVTEQQISYQRGQYPIMLITAEDRTNMWGNLLAVATPEYANTAAEEVIADLIEDYTDLESGDVNVVFTNTEPLSYQWIEVDLKTILEDICDRFGYYLRVDVDDNITAKRISNVNAVDHTYLNIAPIISFTPDDRYSDFTNRVIVMSEENTEIDVTYPEERITQLNGTYTWQGGTVTHKVWYSNDRSRRIQDPRLSVLQTACSIAFQLAGEVSEELQDTSPYEADVNLQYKYCLVIVDAPDLTAYFVASLAGLIASYFIPDTVLTFVFAGCTIRVGSYITAFFTYACLNILAAQGSYQYEIWGVPMGKINRSIQGQWDDTDHQTQIGHIITKKFEEPLCYTIAGCQFVADQTGLILQLQRKRVTFEKIAHLQDEDGDTISLPHPITGQAMKVFITDLERSMKISEQGTNNGYFIDKIEGWVLNG